MTQTPLNDTTPPEATQKMSSPTPEPENTGGNFWASASPGAKTAIVIGAIILVIGLIWALVSVLGGGGNKPAPPPAVTPIPTTAPPTAEAGVPSLVALRDTSIYAGPGADYPEIGMLKSGLGAEVVGSNENKSWWAIKYPSGPNGQGWVANGDVKTNNVDSVPVLQAPPLPTATPVVITDWKGEYFDNANLSGAPVLIRNDKDINFDWGNGAPAPGLPDDHYSVRWSRKAAFENSDYLFTVDLEGGVRLWLDGRMLIDDWVASGNRTLTAHSGMLEAGDHDLRIDYFKSGGQGRISVRWEPVKAAAPVAVIDLPGRLVAGQPAQFSAEHSTADEGHQIVGYQWQFGDGGSSTDMAPVYAYRNAGKYTVSLVVTDDLGQTSESRVDVTVEAPAPPVAVISGPKTGQVGDTLTFSAQDSTASLPISRYDWDFGDGITAQGVQVQHVYQTAGSYRITLTVTDQAGQSASSTLDVVIAAVATPTAPPVEPTMTPPPGQEIIGVNWELTSVAEGRQAPIPTLPEAPITLLLSPDGTYSGSGGCNTYSGSYQILDASQIHFDPPRSGQIACPQPVLEQETQYLNALTRVTTYHATSANQMQLQTSDAWTLFFDRTP